MAATETRETARAAAAPAAERPSLLAFVTDAASETVLREALLGEAGEAAELRRGDVGAAIKVLRRGVTPAALVVDVSGLDQPLSALEELAQVVEPDVRVLVVGDRNDTSFYRALTRSLGVLEYLYKPLTHEMVARHFVGYVRGTADTGADAYLRGGRVIAVTGVRGGVGATTVAGNLAWHLAEQARRHTALLDCDLHAGGTALLLGSRTSGGLRVALEHPDRVDELFVERTAQPVGERLFVLAAEEKLLDHPRIEPGALGRLLEMLRRRFNFVVVDLPARAGPLARDVLDLSHQRVLVCDPSLAGAREALRYGNLPNSPMQARRALLVVNRTGMPGTLSRDQTARALGDEPDLLIPWLPKLVPVSADLGEPAVSKRGAFRDAIEQLGRQVAAVAGAEPAPRRGFFRRRFG